jgi:hypothetical protein
LGGQSGRTRGDIVDRELIWVLFLRSTRLVREEEEEKAVIVMARWEDGEEEKAAVMMMVVVYEIPWWQVVQSLSLSFEN